MPNFVNLLDIVYPVGSMYFSTSSASPASTVGGTWEQIKDAVIAASGSKYSSAVAHYGGSKTIATSQMPAHQHSGTTNSDGNHDHSVDGRIIAWYGAGKGNVLQGAGNYFGSVGSFGGQQTSINGAHTHSFTTNSAGNGDKYIPYHYSINVYKRTA
jgi:hypothetical protein